MKQICMQFVTICTILTYSILMAYCVPINGVIYFPDCKGDGNYNFDVGFYPFPDGGMYAKGTVHDIHAGAMNDQDWEDLYVDGFLLMGGWIPDSVQLPPTWLVTGGASIYYYDNYHLRLTLPNYPSWITLSMTLNDLPNQIPLGSEGSPVTIHHTHI